MSLILLIQLAVGAFLGWISAYYITKFSIGYAKRFGVVARPNKRTFHEGAIPRIGGVGVAIPYLSAIALLLLVQKLGFSESLNKTIESILGKSFKLQSGFLLASLLGGVGAFIMGLWDDVKTLHAIPKLILQLVIAGIPIIFGVRLAHISLPGIGWWEIHPLIGCLLGFGWIMFWMNAYNFMDGINGIAGRFGEVVTFSLLVITSFHIWPLERVLLSFLFGVCYGFLAWNIPTAKTFMGDCGSQFLGFIFAVWTLYLPHASMELWSNFHTGAPKPQAGYPFWSMLVLMLPFFWDVIYTLCRRALNGENLMKAHRSHLYQRLTATYSSHAVSLSRIEKYFILCAIPAMVMTVFIDSDHLIGQWGSLAFAFGVMIIYTLDVKRKEKKFFKSSHSDKEI